MSSTASSCHPRPPIEYIKQPEVLLAAPSASLAHHAAKPAHLLQPLWPAPCSQKCFLLPLWPVMQSNLLVSFSLSGLSHTATTACCCLRQPPMAYMISQRCFLLPPSASLIYVMKPHLLVSFSLFWPISCSGQHDNNTVIISMDEGEYTNPYTVTKSLHLQPNHFLQCL